MADIETRRFCHACGQFHVFRDDLCWGCLEAVRRLAAEYETRRLCHACGQFHVFLDDLCWGCLEAVRRLAAEYETFGQDTPEPATNAISGETR